MVVAAAVLGLTACSSGAVIADKPAASTTVTPTPSPSVPAVGAVGARTNPVTVGTPAKYDSRSVWTFTFGATDPDAWPEISAANQFNQAATEGSTYVTAPVHIEAANADSMANGADPSASYVIEYVTVSGNTFGSQTCLASLPAPGDINSVGTMYGGAKADFLTCAVVPTGDVSGGAWKVTSIVGGTASAFFASA